MFKYHQKLLSSKGERAMSDKIIQLNEGVIKQELSELVRQSVEDTLNSLLDEEADRLTNATRYERTEGRQDTRAGSYKRKLLTKAGEVELKIPRLRTLPFETAIIQRYQKREISVEEALVEMYLAGVSVRRVEDITQALWGAKVSAGTISKLNQKVYGKIEEWRQRQLLLDYPYVYLDGIYLKRNWGGSYENVSILVAMAVNEEGQREVIGAAEGMKEDQESWLNFLKSLKERGLRGVRLFIGDKCLGLLGAINTVFPQAQYQRCTVHFYRNVFSVVPRGKVKDVAAMLKAIHAQEDRLAALEKAKIVVQKLREMKLKEAAKKVEESIAETLTYMSFPSEHRLKIRSNNAIERLNREIRRRTRVVGAFPDGQSALMLVCARLRYMEDSLWGMKLYLNMKHLETMDLGEEVAADLTAG
jgi:putative transposase